MSPQVTVGVNSDHDLLIRIDERTSELLRQLQAVNTRHDEIEKKVAFLEKVTYTGLGALAVIEFLLRTIWKA